MSDGESNLRLLPVAEPDEELLTSRDPEDPHCRHDRSELDQTAHRLFCRDCRAELDPFDYLVRMHNQRERWRRDGESARARMRLAKRELEDAERRLKNAKARLRKQGVLLTAAEANAAREQLRAMAHVVIDLVGDRDEALARAKLCGFRQDDAKKALDALDGGIAALTVRA